MQIGYRPGGEGHALGAVQSGRQFPECLDLDLARIGSCLGDDDQRAVGARSEALRDEVVGPASGGVLREVALVGEAEAQPQHRRGQHEQHHRAARREQPGPGLDHTTEPVPAGLPQRLGLPVPHCTSQRVGRESERPGHQYENGHGQAYQQRSEAGAESEQRDAYQRGGHHAPDPGRRDPVAEEADGGRQQRDRPGHDQGHGGGRGQAQPGHEGQTDEQQAQKRHHHGGAGEDHGPAGRVERSRGGVLTGQAAADPLPVAGDDEQRVVDANADADHEPEGRSELGHGHDVAQHDDAGRPDSHAGQGRGDGQAHGHYRAHRQYQHEHREGKPDGFGLGRIALGQPGPAHLHLHAVHRAQPGDLDQVVDLDADVSGLDGGGAGSGVDVGVGDEPGLGAPGRDAMGSVRSVGRADGDPLDGLDPPEEIGHGGLHGRVGDALLGPEHDPTADHRPDAAEVLVEDVGPQAALGVGSSRRAAVRRAHATRSRGRDHNDQNPGDQDPPRVPVAPPAER